MEEGKKLIVTAAAAIVLAIGVLVALVAGALVSLPFILLALVFGALVGAFFLLISALYVVYAFVERMFFGKNDYEGKSRRYSMKQSREAK
jgi:uncharacterized membrane protein YqgA involved in biofilm formation